MAYIYPAPGVSGVQSTLSISVQANGSDTGLTLPALQDVTVNNANDVFTWTQLDSGSKQQIATTATNSLGMNLVLEQASFFGDSTTTANTAAYSGVFGLSKNKTKVSFSLYLGDTDGGATGKTITGDGYITGLAPTVSADAPVWVTPITITVDGDYTVS
tara:strand:+ start:1303 stop:1779 length:477 start_codon:yes stop_codon:yes gene_type:complete